MKHEYSTAVLVGFLFIFGIVLVGAIFTTDDVDEMCSNANSTLYRNDTTWDCMTVVYGELSGQDIGEVAMAGANTYYNITNMTVGHSNGITLTSGNMTILADGIYKTDVQISFSGTPNNEYHIRINKNGVEEEHCHSERVIGSGGDVGSASVTCIDDYVNGDLITLQMENTDSAGNPTIHSMNLNIMRLTR